MNLSFPSPRGVELHKPSLTFNENKALGECFRPLAGLSCISREAEAFEFETQYREFPSPRGVELHKP